MSKRYIPENLPAEFPIDKGLLIEAETIPGIDAHDRNSAASSYKISVKLFRDEPNAQHWFMCVKYERLLRGIVGEAKANRYRVVKPLHQ